MFFTLHSQTHTNVCVRECPLKMYYFTIIIIPPPSLAVVTRGRLSECPRIKFSCETSPCLWGLVRTNRRNSQPFFRYCQCLSPHLCVWVSVIVHHIRHDIIWLTFRNDGRGLWATSIRFSLGWHVDIDFVYRRVPCEFTDKMKINGFNDAIRLFALTCKMT